MRLHQFFFVLLLLPIFLFAQQAEKITDDLSVVPLSANTYAHRHAADKYLWRVGCNGLVYIRNGEAVIMDTPPDSVQSLALLRWIEKRFPEPL